MAELLMDNPDGLLQRLQVLVYPDRGRFEPTDLSPDLDARDRGHNVFKGLADLDVEKFVGHALGESEEVPYLNFDDEAQEVFNAGGPPSRATSSQQTIRRPSRATS